MKNIILTTIFTIILSTPLLANNGIKLIIKDNTVQLPYGTDAKIKVYDIKTSQLLILRTDGYVDLSSLPTTANYIVKVEGYEALIIDPLSDIEILLKREQNIYYETKNKKIYTGIFQYPDTLPTNKKRHY